jgi:aldehyde dehydrogenase (NAD+)
MSQARRTTSTKNGTNGQAAKPSRDGARNGDGPLAHAIGSLRTTRGAKPSVKSGKKTAQVITPRPAPWSYSPAPETVKVDIRPAYGHFIGGAFTSPGASASDTFATINPATEVELARVSQGSLADVDAAVKAARKAFPKWAALPAAERGKYLFRIARRIQERARELAVLETMDCGKPIKESRDADIPLAAAHFFYHAGWADKLQYAFPGWRSEHRSRKADVDGTDQAAPGPLGVCAQIIPWNFPLLMAAWKLAPALACGNTCILKPAETTPLTALRLAEIFEEVGLPPGVVNIITGDGRTGAALAGHAGVDKVAFTGSTEVGKKIAKAAAAARANGSHAKLTLELGGKSPHIIFDDAPIDQAVEGIISGIYFNQGEVCCAGSRLFVQENILDEVVEKLTIRLASLRMGDPLDKNTDVGAINSRAQLERIEHYLSVGEDEGARCVRANNSPVPEKGFWCRPCFLTGVHPSHVVAREEIFGPVLCVMSFRTPEEAVLRANNTPYGLAAGIWTDKGSKIFDTARRLKAGVVWCNTYNKFDPASPFGGFKESGFGREGGVHGLRGYVSL